ncbi:MAG TPA: MarR family transcriptional regulator [Candidatus Paenalcaligenes intestinipullorum]|uniref:MarR family transcriptional regulator n=1 Tax=Candidatus Paenalcaligenes intestinipullorum TaxID=2838718 RepID=A0A9D2RJG3_9BURK|nr:MarR family transcriptional regulator [Candidatus Paenalcaligenes intestinipullorum]
MKIHDTSFTPEPTAFPDLESRISPDDHHDLHLWLRMQSCSTLIVNELRTRLRQNFQTTLPRFDLMAQLSQNQAGMKMSDLSRQMMVTNGNITGIVDQLEKEGLIERIRPLNDRRSSLIRLTPTGQQSYQTMAAAHQQWLNELFVALPEQSRQHLFEHLGVLKQLARTVALHPAA